MRDGVLARRDGVDDARELVAQEDRHDGGRCLVRAEAVIVACGRDRGTQQLLIIIDGLDDRGQRKQENVVVRRIIARVEHIETGCGDGPVVMLARTVDALEGFLVEQAGETMVGCRLTQDLHRQKVIVDGDVRAREDGRDFVLARSDLVMLGLGIHAHAP